MRADEAVGQQFYLTGSVLGSSKSIAISSETFAEVAEAHAFYVNVILIEEKYDTVVENYYEFERELIEIAARHMLFEITDEVFFGQTSLINRRLLNLLSATKMYIDHTRKQLIAMFGRKSNLVVSISEKSEAVKAANTGYLLLEQIRNYSQHAGYAVEYFSVGASSTRTNDKVLRYYDLRAKINIDNILGDPRIDRSLRDKASEIQGRDAKDLIRDGIDGVSEVHQHLRDGIDLHLTARRDVLHAALALYQNQEPMYANESPILVKKENSTTAFHRYISRDIIHRLENYRRKNKQLRGLTNRRVIS